MRARLRVERAWGRSTLTEEFLLGHRGDHLKVRERLDWREPAHLLKPRFPTALSDARATYEISFGVLERLLDGPENSAHSWVDLSGTVRVGGRVVPAGLAVINTANHGFDTALGADGGSPSIGMTTVRSAEPGVFLARSAGAGAGGGVRLLGKAMRESFQAGVLPDRLSFAANDGGPVTITALKGSEDDDALIIRALATNGRRASAPAGAAAGWLDGGRRLRAVPDPDVPGAGRGGGAGQRGGPDPMAVARGAAAGVAGRAGDGEPVRLRPGSAGQREDRAALAEIRPGERLAPGEDESGSD